MFDPAFFDSDFFETEEPQQVTGGFYFPIPQRIEDDDDIFMTWFLYMARYYAK